MAGIENEEKSGRERVVGRLRERHPDKSFEDDEEIYGQVGEDYDDYERRVGEYGERERAISDMFAEAPHSAEYLAALSKGDGRNAVIQLLKKIGPDIKNALEDEAVMGELADAWEEEQTRIVNSRKLDEEYAANMSASLDALRQYQSRAGLTDEQTDEIIFGLIGIVRDGVMGKFTEEAFEMMRKAINHDSDVAVAQEEGTVAGRNERVTERLRKRGEGDGVAPLGGRNGAPSGGLRGGSIFDLAGEAM